MTVFDASKRGVVDQDHGLCECPHNQFCYDALAQPSSGARRVLSTREGRILPTLLLAAELSVS